MATAYFSAKNAESLGYRAWNVKTEDQLRAALTEARNEILPCVICIETELYRYSPGANLWWDVSVAEVTNDPVHPETAQAIRKGNG